MVFQQAAEGMYGAPEYGGNKDLVGWKYIKYPGDAQPRGYTAAEMIAPDSGAPISVTQLEAFDLETLFAHLAFGTPRAAKTPWKGRRGF